MCEGEQIADRLNGESREACVRLLRRTPKVFVDQNHFGRNPRPLHNRLAAYLVRIDFNKITSSPVHHRPLIQW